MNWLLHMDHQATMRYNLNFLPQDVDSDPEDLVPIVNTGSPLEHLKPSICDIWQHVELVHIRNCYRKTIIILAEWTVKKLELVPRHTK